ncbi:hypothetical protein BCL76_106141 [Streptomyces sp. CG 926]|uniref:hypothetical protein n=1 Tax=Streptomyces sp. CG 926 TaxID=1882405 RepID=UPI000D6D11C7|nr:hypothetical protein [Streptomyces sp. CG 926]PWK69425.1 hypothetical protein BCL76_106141 [Streptomyces sp. CG 926]
MKWPGRAKPQRGGPGAGAGRPVRAEPTERAEQAAQAEAAAQAETARRHLIEERWGRQTAAWADWLARSPAGVDLHLWWQRQNDLVPLIGEEPYRDRLAELLSRAAPRDLAAMGLGCSRRVDRACRTPEVCGQDPEPRPDVRPFGRSGPVPGACSSFIDCYTSHEIRVRFSGDDRHSAVMLLRGGPGEARLWVDGVPVLEGEWLDNGGHWLDERFFVIRIGGPDDHPEQGYTSIGQWLYDIVSLLVYDAELRIPHVLIPGPTENWRDPVADVRDGTVRVYADEAAQAAATPDREFPVGAPPTG